MDAAGRAWKRRGERESGLTAKRVRSLLRRDDVPLVIWSVGDVDWFEDQDRKAAAALDLYAEARGRAEVRAVEWKAEGSDKRLLMLELHC